MSKSKSSTHLSQVQRLLELEVSKPIQQNKEEPQEKSKQKGLKSKSKQKKRKPRAKAKPKEKQEKKESNKSKSIKKSKNQEKSSNKSQKSNSSNQSSSQDNTASKSKNKSKSKSQKQKQQKTTEDIPDKTGKKKGGGRKKKDDKSVKKGEKEQTKKPRGKKQKDDNKNDKQSSIGDNSSSRQLVLDYVTKQNRPYSLINIFDNLHKAVKKPALQALLQQLSSDKEVTIKQFGKVKIYMLYQDQFKISNQEMQRLTVQLGNFRQEQKQLNNQNKSLANSLRTILAKPTFEQMKKQQMCLQAQINKLQQKMDVYGNNWVGVPQQTVVQVQKRTSKNIKQAKKRQKLVKSIIKDLQQITGMKRNQLIDKLGIDMNN